ncbi:MAG: hypothetical protein SVT56_04530 [Chloroflexota bacterium]|nr:hypothetical protein [Chloroflexota bacterium]
MIKNSFNRWIFESYSVSPQGLGLFRIASSLFFLFFLMPDTESYSFLSSLPADLYAPPPGPMMLLDEFPPEYIFWLIHSLLFISLCLVLVGYQTKVSSIATGIFVLMISGLAFSIGKINHNILLGMAPIVMAFSNWGNAFSVDAVLGKTQREVESWPLTLLALMIGFMMFTAGFPKILGGWLDPATQATEGHFLNQFFGNDRQAMLAPYVLYLKIDLIWELMDWSTIIFEIGFLLAVLKSRWFKVFICFALIFHFSNLLILNIIFTFNFIAYAAFLDWTKIFVKWREWLSDFTKKTSFPDYYSGIIFGVVLFILFLAIRIISDMDILLQDSAVVFHDVLFSALAVVIVIFLVVRKARLALNNRREMAFT